MENKTGKRSRLRFYIILFTSILLVLLLSSLFFLPRIYHTQLEQAAREKISEAVTANVAFTHFHTSFLSHFPGITLTLEDISVADSAIRGDTLMKAREVTVVIDMWDFIARGEIGLKNIFAKDPVIHAWIAKNGKTNFTIFKKDTSRTAGEERDVHFHGFEIENGHISFVDRMRKTNVAVDGFNGSVSGDFLPDYYDVDVEADAEDVGLTFSGKEYFTRKRLGLALQLKANRITEVWNISQGKLRLNDFTLDTDGSVRVRPDRLGIDLKFKSSKSEFKDILSLATFLQKDMKRIQTSGKVDFEGYAKGDLLTNLDSIPVFEMHMNIEDASLKIDTIPQAIDQVNLNLHLKNMSGVKDSLYIDLDSLHVRIGEHKIYGHVHYHGLKKSNVDADIKGDLHFHELLSVYPIKGLGLEGEIDFTIKAKGRYINTDNEFALPFVDGDFEIKNGKVKYDTLPGSLNNVHIRFHYHSPADNWRNTEIIVEHLEMDVNGNPVDVKLTWKGLSSPVIQGYVKATLPLEEIGKVFPLQGQQMKGLLTTTINVNGVFNKDKKLFPQVDASIKISDGYFKSDTYPRPMENIQLESKMVNTTGLASDTQLEIDKLLFTLDGDRFDVSGNIADFNTFRYNLLVDGSLDFGKLTQVYPLENWKVTGTLQTDINLSGTFTDLAEGRYDRTKASGNIHLNDVLLDGVDIPQSIFIKAASMSLSSERIALTELEGKSGNSDFRLAGELTNYWSFVRKDGSLIRGKLQWVSDMVDLNDWRQWFNGDENAKSDSAGSSIIRIPSNVDFMLDSDLRHVRFDDINITNMKGNIRLQDGIMYMSETGFNSLNAQFFVSGTYDSRQPQPVFDFNLNIDALDIQRAYNDVRLIRQLAPAAGDTKGIFSVNYFLKGEFDNSMHPKMETLTGSGTMHVGDAVINGMKMFTKLSKTAKKKELQDPHLKNFTVQTEIRNKKLFVKPFEVKVGGWQTEIEGVNSIDGTINYSIKVELFSIDRLKIPFHVTGTYDDPKIALGKRYKLPDE